MRHLDAILRSGAYAAVAGIEAEARTHCIEPERIVWAERLVPSREAPGGIGEPGTSVVLAALANAVSAATGQRLRGLPLRPNSA